MTKRISIRKLDKRYTGSKDFQYFVKPGNPLLNPLGGFYQLTKLRYEIFFDLRVWCWQTWGPSCEYSLWSHVSDEQKNKHWAWDTENTKMRIYLASDKEAAWVRLKWE